MRQSSALAVPGRCALLTRRVWYSLMPLRKMMKNRKQMQPMMNIRYRLVVICPSAGSKKAAFGAFAMTCRKAGLARISDRTAALASCVCTPWPAWQTCHDVVEADDARA